jgi:hypothetical protein
MWPNDMCILDPVLPEGGGARLGPIAPNRLRQGGERVMSGETIEPARNRWREILPQRGIETRFLTNKHGPCRRFHKALRGR